AQLEELKEHHVPTGYYTAEGTGGKALEIDRAFWERSRIPPTIRSPRRVFEDLEDEMEEATNKNEEELAALRARWGTAQSMGASAAYAQLPQAQRNTYEDTTIAELAAYANFLRYAALCSLNCEEMADWLTEDPKAMLAADPRWAPLLKNEERTDNRDLFPKKKHHSKTVRFRLPEPAADDGDASEHDDAYGQRETEE
ncbi:unnamed protein product, partial [Prorocentrum cordatum]